MKAPRLGDIRAEEKTNIMQVYDGTNWVNLKRKLTVDSGYFYCPYIPLDFIKTISESERYDNAMKTIEEGK